MRRRRRASVVPTPALWWGLLLVLVLRSLSSTVAVLPPHAAPALAFVPLVRPRQARPAARSTTALAASHNHHLDAGADGLADPPAAMQPRHVAIIPDGNGRWAQRRGLPRAVGHQEGAKRAFEVLQACQQLGGIELVTLYCLSTENWTRPPGEISVILGCVEASLRANIAYAHANRIRLTVVGQRERLPPSLQQLIVRAESETGGYGGLTVCLALSYGGRDDIVQAARRLAAEAASGQIKVEEIDEGALARRLQTGGLGDLAPPDLIIRTSGERRLSNFMLFESAYAELYVADEMWPDFGPAQLRAAVWDYARRRRRYGGVGEEELDERVVREERAK